MPAARRVYGRSIVRIPGQTDLKRASYGRPTFCPTFWYPGWLRPGGSLQTSDSDSKGNELSVEPKTGLCVELGAGAGYGVDER